MSGNHRFENMNTHDASHCLFHGDIESDGPARGAPLAWTLLWGDAFDSMCADDIDESTRRWGYVIWDASRLEKTGAIKLFKQPRKVRHQIPSAFDTIFKAYSLLVMIHDAAK